MVGFTRIDTVTIPDVFISFIDVSDRNPAGLEEIGTILEKDMGSID